MNFVGVVVVVVLVEILELKLEVSATRKKVRGYKKVAGATYQIGLALKGIVTWCPSSSGIELPTCEHPLDNTIPHQSAQWRAFYSMLTMGAKLL